MRGFLSRCFVGSLRTLSGPFCAPQKQVVTRVAVGRRLHLSRKSMQYLTEERGQPNSPDYRIYFSKFCTILACAHKAGTPSNEWGRCDGVLTPSHVEAQVARPTFAPPGLTSQAVYSRSRCKPVAGAGSFFRRRLLSFLLLSLQGIFPVAIKYLNSLAMRHRLAVAADKKGNPNEPNE